MTTLGQCWSGFNRLWDNRRRWQREWWKMVSERGIHRSGGRWSWEMHWMSLKKIFSISLEEKLHSVSNYFLFIRIILHFQRLWALEGQLGLDTSVANRLWGCRSDLHQQKQWSELSPADSRDLPFPSCLPVLADLLGGISSAITAAFSFIQLLCSVFTPECDSCGLRDPLRWIAEAAGLEWFLAGQTRWG